MHPLPSVESISSNDSSFTNEEIDHNFSSNVICTSTLVDSHNWILDSGTTDHMCFDNSIFDTFSQSQNPCISTYLLGILLLLQVYAKLVRQMACFLRIFSVCPDSSII